MPKTENDFPLNSKQVMALLQLALSTYHEQAGKSLNAGAPLASCVMLGATVEAVLTVVTCLLYDDAVKTGKAPKQGEKTKDLLDWSFYELLDVAKAANWLPKRLTLDKRLDRAHVKTVPTDTIRKVRNLVHPARYLKERSGKEYTVEEVHTLYATCHAAYDCLVNQIRVRYPHLGAFKSF